MIHAYALEPALVASWGRRPEFRFIRDKFGIGTPRAMLELPSFTKWKRAVYAAATEAALSPEDMKRLEELFRLFAEHKCRRAGIVGGLPSWLEDAEREYDRRIFAAILATSNPRRHPAVLMQDQLDPSEPRWARATGAAPARTAEAFADALSAMLAHCRVLHLVDPYFGFENARHRKVFEAMMGVLEANANAPEVVRIHCAAKPTLKFFEEEAAKMAGRLPAGIEVQFRRWKQRGGGELLHNRYVLTDLGGVSFGVGLDAGREGETDDVSLLTHTQYVLRWSQYVDERGFDVVDTPSPVRGSRRSRAGRA